MRIAGSPDSETHPATGASRATPHWHRHSGANGVVMKRLTSIDTTENLELFRMCIQE